MAFNTTLPTLPAEGVFLSSPTVGSNGTTIQYTTEYNRWAGISFSPASDVMLEEVSFLIGASWNATILGKEMRIDVVSLGSLNGTPDYNAIPSIVLRSETGNLPASAGTLTTSDSFYLSFKLENSVALAAGKAYGIVVSFTDVVDNNTRGMSMRLSDTKNSGGIGFGLLSEDHGGTWTNNTNTYVFSLKSSAIPEPSTYALVSGALILIGVMLRRRKS